MACSRIPHLERRERQEKNWCWPGSIAPVTEKPKDLIGKSFKSCGIANEPDGSEDDAVWEEEDEETEDAEEIIDNEFETDNEGEEGE